MNYDVSVNFKRKVSEKELPDIIKSVSAVKIDGFDAGEISSHKSYDEETGSPVQPVRIVGKKKSKKIRSVGGKK